MWIHFEPADIRYLGITAIRSPSTSMYDRYPFKLSKIRPISRHQNENGTHKLYMMTIYILSAQDFVLPACLYLTAKRPRPWVWILNITITIVYTLVATVGAVGAFKNIIKASTAQFRA